MAVISVYRATVNVGSEFAGEVYSFAPLLDCLYVQSLQFKDMNGYGLMPEAMQMRNNSEIRLVVPDELFIERGFHGTPEVRVSTGTSKDTYNAWGLIEQVRAKNTGFRFATEADK
jgi:hypothetical protein